MLCPVYGHELTPLSCPPSQGVSFRSFKGLIILSPYTGAKDISDNTAHKTARFIADAAALCSADVIVFEHPDRNGRKSGSEKKSCFTGERGQSSVLLPAKPIVLVCGSAGYAHGTPHPLFYRSGRAERDKTSYFMCTFAR